MRKRWSALMVAAATMLAGAVGLVAPESASAASCSGASCYNQDPVATGCNNDAVTVGSVWDGNVFIELRWSNTCQANWTRISNLPTWPYDFRVENANGQAESANFGWFGPASGWTYMVNGHNILARACDNTVCTGWH